MKYSQEMKERAQQLRDAGYQGKEIAEMLGCSLATVFTWTSPTTKEAVKKWHMASNHDYEKAKWVDLYGYKIHVKKVPVSARGQLTDSWMKKWMYMPVVRINGSVHEVLKHLEMIFGGGLSLLPDRRKGYYGVSGLGDVKDWCKESVETWKEALERVT